MPRLPPLYGSEVRSALAPSPNGGGRSSRVSSELNTEKPPKRSRSASRGSLATLAPPSGRAKPKWAPWGSTFTMVCALSLASTMRR